MSLHRRDANYQSSPLSSWTWILSCDLVQVYSQPSYMNLNCDIFSSTASIYQWSDRFLVLILDLHPEKSGWLGHRPFDYTGKKKKKFSSPTPNSINKQEFWLSICVTWRKKKKKNKILEHVSWRSLETQHYCIVDCNKNQPYLNCDFSIICIQVIFTNSLSTVCGCLICSWNELKTNSMLAMT